MSSNDETDVVVTAQPADAQETALQQAHTVAPPSGDASRERGGPSVADAQWRPDFEEPTAWERLRGQAVRMHHGGGGGSGGRRAAAAAGGGGGGGSGRGGRDNGPSNHATSAEPASVGTAQPSRALPARSRKPARGFASAASSSRLGWDDVGMSAREAHDLRQALRNSVLIDRMSDGSEAALPEAPTFTPTAAEFADPIEYISSIR